MQLSRCTDISSWNQKVVAPCYREMTAVLGPKAKAKLNQSLKSYYRRHYTSPQQHAVKNGKRARLILSVTKSFATQACSCWWFFACAQYADPCTDGWQAKRLKELGIGLCGTVVNLTPEDGFATMQNTLVCPPGSEALISKRLPDLPATLAALARCIKSVMSYASATSITPHSRCV